MEAARRFEASVALAKRIGTPREVWLGQSALGATLAGLGRDTEAEACFVHAARVIEQIQRGLTTSALHKSFLSADPVVDVYRRLGRRPPPG